MSEDNDRISQYGDFYPKVPNETAIDARITALEQKFADEKKHVHESFLEIWECIIGPEIGGEDAEEAGSDSFLINLTKKMLKSKIELETANEKIAALESELDDIQSRCDDYRFLDLD